MRIVTTISGPETTPLITADQNSARNGIQSDERFNDRPINGGDCQHSVKLFRLVWRLGI